MEQCQNIVGRVSQVLRGLEQELIVLKYYFKFAISLIIAAREALKQQFSAIKGHVTCLVLTVVFDLLFCRPVICQFKLNVRSKKT